jgi:protein gp37
MADSKIEWTDNTWNPTTGCTKISKECDNCYAEVMTKRMMSMRNQPRYKLGFEVFVMHEDALNVPYEWDTPKMVFVNSMSDLFHRDVKLDFLQRVFKVMNDTPQHTYQILTKRHHELNAFSVDLNWTDNIWMGVSVGNIPAVRRIENLVNCGAKHKFLSIEPLIEELPELDLTGIDWVICGGESGSGKIRPMELDWVLKIKDNCEKYNVPFFFKQWGIKKFNPDPNDPTKDKRHKYHAKGGCMLNGELYLENPTVQIPIPSKVELFGESYYVIDDVNELKTIWELKSYLPFMEKDVFNQLKKDIKKNGVTDPILYFETENGDKVVIEGHTRLQAAMDLKIESFPTKKINESFKSLDDVKFWMAQHQIQRRNLSPLERISLAYSFKDVIEQKARENQSKAGKKDSVDVSFDTYEELGKLAGVGRTSVVRYNSIMEKAPNSVKNKLFKGELSISSAYDIVKDKKPKSVIKAEPKKKEIQYKISNNMDECERALANNEIEGIIVINDEKTIQMFTQKQLERLMFFMK